MSKLEKHLEKNSGKKSGGDDATKGTTLSKKKKKDSKKKKENEDAGTTGSKEKKKHKPKAEESAVVKSPKPKKKKGDGEHKVKEDANPKAKKSKTREDGHHIEDEEVASPKSEKKKKTSSKGSLLNDSNQDFNVSKHTIKKKKAKTELEDEPKKPTKKKKKKESPEGAVKEEYTETFADDMLKVESSVEDSETPADGIAAEATSLQKSMASTIEDNSEEDPPADDSGNITRSEGPVHAEAPILDSAEMVDASEQRNEKRASFREDVPVDTLPDSAPLDKTVAAAPQQPMESSQDFAVVTGSAVGVEQSVIEFSISRDLDSVNEKSLGLELQEACEAMMKLIKDDESSAAVMLSLQERLLNVFRRMNSEHLLTGERLNVRDEELQACVQKNEALELEIEKQLEDWNLMESKLVQADAEIKHLLAENQRLEAELKKANGGGSEDPADFTAAGNALVQFSNKIASAQSELEEAQKKLEGL